MTANINRQSRPGGDAAVWFPLIAAAYGIGSAALALGGVVSFAQLLTLLAAPAMALLAVLRPAWPILLLLILPAGTISRAGVSAADLNLLLLLVTITPALVRGRLPFTWGSPLVIFFVLLGLAAVFRAEMGALSSETADATLGSFIYFGLIGFGTYSLVRHGELSSRQLEIAILVSVCLTGSILLILSGFSPATLLQDYTRGAGISEYELYRTHFGMLMVMGLAIATTRIIRFDGTEWRPEFSPPSAVLVLFLIAMTGLSLTRAAWLTAGLIGLLVVWRTRRKAYLALPLLVAVAVTAVPLLNERAFGEVSQGFDRAVASGELGSGRLALWEELGEEVAEVFPLGYGFGYVWTLTPQELFDVTDVFVTAENPFVYPHNDFLFWTIELGVAGLGLFLLFWIVLLRQWIQLNKDPSPEVNRVGFVFGGILVAMFIADIVDNGIFMQPVAEKFFAAAGLVAATATQARDRQPRAPGREGVGR